MKETLPRLALVIVPAWLLIIVSFSFSPIDLTGDLAVVSYWFSEAGGKRGMPLVALAALLLVASRPGLTGDQRVRVAGAIAATLIPVLGGMAVANEFAIKRVMKVPRPNIQELAHKDLLGLTPEAFYGLGGKDERSAHLEQVLTPAALEAVGLPLAERIRHHWIEETGYSFPSGHATAAMTFASFFLAAGIYLLSGWRLLLCGALVPWAIAVCWSRTILRVHSPTDVTVGGLQGVVLGAIGFLILGFLLERFAGEVPQPDPPAPSA